MSSVNLVAGANHRVPQQRLQLDVHLYPPQLANVEVDISAFLLNTQGKVRGDADMVFYGQTHSGNGSVHLQESRSGYAKFSVDLAQIEPDISKIAFSATIHENRQTFASFQRIELQIRDQQQQRLLSANLPTTGMIESALILGEYYLRQEQWKFRAIGQGFAGGLKPLAEHFGVDIADTATPAPSPSTQTTVKPSSKSSVSSIKPSTQTQSSSQQSPPKKPVSLSKITLDKRRSVVSLDKKPTGFGEININLNWHQGAPQAQSSGFLGGFLGHKQQSAIDLDLACLFEMQDGTKGVVQALGNTFGHYQQIPFVELKGDDRTGALQDGEWLRINGQQWSQIKRVLVFAFIYEGVPNWAKTDAVVTVYVPNEAPVEVRLIEGSNDLRMCAIALLSNENGALQVKREVRYFSGHRALDQAYHWGMNWRAGSK